MSENNTRIIDLIIQSLKDLGFTLAETPKEVLAKIIEEECTNAYSVGYETGIGNAVSALYEAKVNDDEIINLLQKYWKLTRNEATKRLLSEKRFAPSRSLRRYLELQGLSDLDIRSFFIKNKVAKKLRENPEFLKLYDNPEKIMKELTKPLKQ